jgi:hypothetical protein
MPYQEFGVAIFIIVPALALAVIAYLWLLVQAFRAGIGWGLAVLFVPPAILLFVPMKWKMSRAPLALFLFACIVFTVGLVVGQRLISRSPRVTMETVDGVEEKHITLTRAKVKKEELLLLLKYHSDVAVLQMNDGFATDETLALLEGLNELRELNLNDTEVSDDGLAHVAKLPKLKILKLNRTKVTDEGFTEHLAGLDHLEQVQLRGTEVKTSTLRKWKNKGKELNLDRQYTSGK